ncbi:MAG TPA: ABC transporter ATP-binding protein [Candidatus Limnocylindrales bacterium]
MTTSLTPDATTASLAGAVGARAVGAGAAATAAADGTTPDVEIVDVTKRFGAVTAVDRMRLSISRGEFYSLLGPSGCGKTTTLRMIAGFEQPTEGEIFLDGKPIAGIPPYRRNVNTVFQHYALFPHMDVARNVGYGLRQRKVGKDEEARRVGEALALVRLAGYERRRTWEMSGGQQQRVALARALVNHPTVLLLDEPLGALDLKLRKEMQLELKALQREVGITFVYVTHDQEEALTMSDVIVVMRDGRIQQQGDPTELYERPTNRFVADFLGSSNFIAATVEGVDASSRTATVRSERGLVLRGTVTDPAAAVAAGDPVTVATRPERLEVRPDDGTAPVAAPGWTELAGRIHQGTYLGDHSEYRVVTDQAGELIVRRQNTVGAGSALGGGPGDPVVVRWHETANLILVG